MKVAALDLGSNTFLCLICDVKNKKIETVYADEVQVVRLGQELQATKKFHPEALARARKTLVDFSNIIQKHRPDKILAMATSAARDAENKEELFSICNDLGIPLEIISGDQEAQITYSGAISGFSIESNPNFLVIDIGGGSTEFIVGKGSRLIAGLSQNMGCVRWTEKFIPAQPTLSADVEKCWHAVEKIIQETKLKFNSKINLDETKILAVAGTPTALAAAELGEFDQKKIDGYKLTQAQLQDWLTRMIKMSVEEKQNAGIPPGRADVIMVGVIILLVTLEVFNKYEMIVSTRGVRYGIALSVEN